MVLPIVRILARFASTWNYFLGRNACFRAIRSLYSSNLSYDLDYCLEEAILTPISE